MRTCSRKRAHSPLHPLLSHFHWTDDAPPPHGEHGAVSLDVRQGKECCDRDGPCTGFTRFIYIHISEVRYLNYFKTYVRNSELILPRQTGNGKLICFESESRTLQNVNKTSDC